MEEEDQQPRPGPKADLRHSKDEYIALGSYSDCDHLLENFLSMRTSTFEDFVKLWQELKFSEIFCGRETFGELLEFTEELFVIAKAFILPPHSQIKRIGALYLIYGLYTQQPTQGIVKFRVTPQEWSIILKFVENLKTHGYIDANYIFHKMCLDGAFLTVSHSREYGLERNMRKYLLPWPARDKERQPFPVFDLETLLSRSCRSSLKTHANSCLSKYNSIKASLSGSSFHPLDGTDLGLDSVLLANINNSLDLESSLTSDIGIKRKRIRDGAFQAKRGAKRNEAKKEDAGKAIPSTSSTVKDTSMPGSDEVAPDTSESDDDLFLVQRLKQSKRKRIPSKSKKVKIRRNLGKAVTDEISSTCQ